MMQIRWIWLGYVFVLFATNLLAENEKSDTQGIALGLTQSGIIEKVYVKLGDQVKAGQTLLSLEQSKFNADVQMAKAAVKRTQVHLNETEREFERTKALHDQTLIAAHEYEVANNAYVAAQAALEQAQAQLIKAQAILKETVIVAPIAGQVVALHALPRQAVVNQCQIQPLITLMQK